MCHLLGSIPTCREHYLGLAKLILLLPYTVYEEKMIVATDCGKSAACLQFAVHFYNLLQFLFPSTCEQGLRLYLLHP